MGGQGMGQGSGGMGGTAQSSSAPNRRPDGRWLRSAAAASARRTSASNHDNAGPLFAGDRHPPPREITNSNGSYDHEHDQPASFRHPHDANPAGRNGARHRAPGRRFRQRLRQRSQAARHHQPAIPRRHRAQRHAQDHRRAVGVQHGARKPARARHDLPDRELLLLQVQLRRRAVLRQHPARERAARPGPGAFRLRAGIHRMEGTGPGGVQGAHQGRRRHHREDQRPFLSRLERHQDGGVRPQRSPPRQAAGRAR